MTEPELHEAFRVAILSAFIRGMWVGGAIASMIFIAGHFIAEAFR